MCIHLSRKKNNNIVYQQVEKALKKKVKKVYFYFYECRCEPFLKLLIIINSFINKTKKTTMLQSKYNFSAHLDKIKEKRSDKMK